MLPILAKMDEYKDKETLKEKMKSDTILKVFKKPPIPAMSMKQKQLESYFPDFINILYEKQGLKRKDKWALKNNGILVLRKLQLNIEKFLNLPLKNHIHMRELD